MLWSFLSLSFFSLSSRAGEESRDREGDGALIGFMTGTLLAEGAEEPLPLPLPEPISPSLFFLSFFFLPSRSGEESRDRDGDGALEGFAAGGFGTTLLAEGAEDPFTPSLSFLSFSSFLVGLFEDFVGMDLVGTGLH